MGDFKELWGWKTPHLLVRAVLPYLASPGGRIVNVGSVVARTGAKQAALYSCTKSALNTLTLVWAEELGEKGITVNVISPGPIDTDYDTETTPWFYGSLSILTQDSGHL